MTTLKSRPNDAVLGAFSGFITGVILQPLEIIKVCLIVKPVQVSTTANSNFLSGSYSTAKLIYQLEGIKGFWKGLSPAILEMVCGSAIYFHILHHLNKRLQLMGGKGAHSDFASSALARATSAYLCNPLAVIRTRIQMPGFTDYTNVRDGIMKIYQRDGIRGYFLGCVPSILKDAPFAGLHYSFMNVTKKYLKPLQLSQVANTMTSGIIAGMVATAITHPLEIVRTAVQAEPSNSKRYQNQGVVQIMTHLWNQEGMKGFARGLAPRLIKKPLANAMAFTLFESFSNNKH